MAVAVPKGLRPLMTAAPQQGRVERIGTRPVRHGAVAEVSSWDLADPKADHGNKTGKRAVTLIQAEHIASIAALSGAEFDALELRRNLVVSGVNLESLRQHGRFAVGDVVLEGTVECDPCNQMEDLLGPGGLAAMMGMGGICARIVTGGTIRVGDVVRRLPPEPADAPESSEA